MESQEIKDLLTKMHALVEEDGDLSVDSRALMQDPIVTNRLAVELLQQVDGKAKPEVVVAPAGEASYFGYSVALAAWMRFVYAEGTPKPALPEGVGLSKKEKALIVLDSYDEATACALVDLVKAQGAHPLAVLSLTGSFAAPQHGCPCLALL